MGAALLAPLLACSTLPLAEAARVPLGEAARVPLAEAARVPVASTVRALPYEPLGSDAVAVDAAPLTVEKSWILSVYTVLHATDYSVRRLSWEAQGGGTQVAYWLVPDAPGPHATVIVFPILAGSHLVSEALAKVLVNRGYAVVRLERRGLALETARSPDTPTRALRGGLIEARRLLEWLVGQRDVDADRIGVAGISLGGTMAATLMGVDPRVRAGFFAMAGGGLPEIMYDSAEDPVELFRDHMIEREGLESREAFLSYFRPRTAEVDPLTHAGRIDPRSVLLVSGRFDRVMPPERTEALWEALGRPAWAKFPAGHYQFFPYFWWAAGRGADHLDAVLGPARREAAESASSTP